MMHRLARRIRWQVKLLLLLLLLEAQLMRRRTHLLLMMSRQRRWNRRIDWHYSRVRQVNQLLLH